MVLHATVIPEIRDKARHDELIIVPNLSSKVIWLTNFERSSWTHVVVAVQRTERCLDRFGSVELFLRHGGNNMSDF